MDRIMSNATVEQLEARVKLSHQRLDELASTLRSVPTAKSEAWLKRIEQIRRDVKSVRVVIGVVGNTGAGKSSLINALLDEEKLVPTSGMRSCTAAATEISYNYSDDPSQLYRAEIDFIDTQDWSQELKSLLGDLRQNDQQSKDFPNADTPAGLAYAKLKAVYPEKNMGVLIEGNPCAMSEEASVREVLGTVKRISETTASDLYNSVQRYIDSKDPRVGNEGSMEYWPLIKSVRIYCKAPALSTGAVIVDLPGSQDSNTARAAVADSYMKACNGIWITAAVQRAVNDKTAQKLLGDSFKRQLKYDGMYSAVSFICTKTDDILVEEVARACNIENEVKLLLSNAQAAENQKEEFLVESRRLKDERSAMNTATKELGRQMQQWKGLLSKLVAGEAVFRSEISDKKRKRSSEHGEKCKKPDLTDQTPDSSSDSEDDSSSDDCKDQSIQRKHGPPLTKEEINKELAAIKARKNELKKSKTKCKDEIDRVTATVKSMEHIGKGARSEATSKSIRARNKWSRDTIKEQFAQGIREQDEEAQIEINPDSFDPSQPARDYDEIAATLPVFCVSARAFQKLSGRIPQQNLQVDGFQSLEMTEIPALQSHAQQLTESSRASRSRSFLNEVNDLLNTTRIFIANDSPNELGDLALRSNEKFIQAELKKLEVSLITAARACVSQMNLTLEKRLFTTFATLVAFAANSGNEVSIAEKWGAPPSQGGLSWSTYRATVKRSGAFTGKNGSRDFNAELFEPISKNLVNVWELVFRHSFPQSLEFFAHQWEITVDRFHHKTLDGVPFKVQSQYGLVTLSEQVQNRIACLETAWGSLKEEVVDEAGRTANRMFAPAPAIQKVMEDTYVYCSEQTGPGSYARMKLALTRHVEQNQRYMLEQATETVEKELRAMLLKLETSLMDLIKSILSKLERDFMAVFVCGPQLKEEQELRELLRKLLMPATGEEFAVNGV